MSHKLFASSACLLSMCVCLSPVLASSSPAGVQILGDAVPHTLKGCGTGVSPHLVLALSCQKGLVSSQPLTLSCYAEIETSKWAPRWLRPDLLQGHLAPQLAQGHRGPCRIVTDPHKCLPQGPRGTWEEALTELRCTPGERQELNHTGDVCSPTRRGPPRMSLDPVLKPLICLATSISLFFHV